MTIVAHAYPFVIGVDTHAKTHTLSILATPNGEIIDEATFPTTHAGLTRAITWAARRTEAGLDVLWVIECAATFGAQLAHQVNDAGYLVVEAARMSSKASRGIGKSDPLDARRIAAAVLPLETDRLRHLRADNGVRAGLRVLVAARDLMTTQRTANINALTALLRAVDLGIDARKPLTPTQIAEITRWRRRQEDIGIATARAEAVRLAQHITTLDDELTENLTATNTLLDQSPARALLDKTGIGPVTAAIAMTAWSHDGRVRDEAAFASLAGVNPIPASSGNTVRHRLNRGGDRRLNRALHMAVVNRMTHDKPTRAYVERRTAEGLTKKDIRRILKRYLARQIYRTLTATARTTNTHTTPA
ncbi:MAG: IS110 family transposase [Propionibacteriaceae bacterium]|nr:IS110 family transposase [Propionibacteriaceae bacterium]